MNYIFILIGMRRIPEHIQKYIVEFIPITCHVCHKKIMFTEIIKKPKFIFCSLKCYSFI